MFEGEEQMVKCPFNPLHVMTKDSLQRHILRCMKNYPNYKVCPYNALHRFATSSLLSEHMMVCPSRSKTMFYDSNEGRLNNDQLYHTDNTRSFNLEYENWDIERVD